MQAVLPSGHDQLGLFGMVDYAHRYVLADGHLMEASVLNLPVQTRWRLR